MEGECLDLGGCPDTGPDTHRIGPHSGITLLSLPIGPEATVVGLRDGEAVVVLTLSVRDGRVDHIHANLDPEPLAQITAAVYG